MASVLKVNEIQHSGGTTALTIDSSGYILQPSKPAFKATVGGSNLTPSGYSNPQVWPDVTDVSRGCHNVGNHYSTSTGKFTVPITGVYWFGLSVLMTSFGAGDRMEIGMYRSRQAESHATDYSIVYGGRNAWVSNTTGWSDQYMGNNCFVTVYCEVGDRVYSSAYKTGSTPVITTDKPWNWFAGYLIG